MDPESALRRFQAIEEQKKAQEEAVRREQQMKVQREQEDILRQKQLRIQIQHQERKNREIALIEENAGGRIFEAIAKSLEDSCFANEIIHNLERSGPDALHLATFDHNCINYQCLPQYRLPEPLMATGSELRDDVYYHPHYRSIRTGPFAGWCLKTTYVSRGIIVGGSSHFTLEKVGWVWRLFGY